MSWSGGLGPRHGRLGLDGFDLGDMGLIEEGDEEFEEDFQEPSTFYDGTPSAFKASPDARQSYRLLRKATDLPRPALVKHSMGRKSSAAGL